MSSILFSEYTNTLFFCQISGISLTRGKEFRKYFPQGFESEADKATYEWWRSKLLIDGFNAACKNIAASFLKVGDEYMSAICFQLTSLVLYFPQDRSTGDRSQDSCLFCYRDLAIH